MKRLLTSATTFFLAFSVFCQSQNFFVHYATNAYKLSPQQTKSIDSLINSQNITFLSITGHTDQVGDSLYNIVLSKKRAVAIQEYITAKYPQIRTEIRFYGENKPKYKNETAKPLNRRVELTFEPEKNWLKVSSLQQLFDIINPGHQEFVINPERDTVLLGSQGSVLVVKSGTFTPTNKGDSVILIFKERFSKESIVRENLTTISNTLDPMVSQGMFYLEAKHNNQQLSFHKDVTVITPVENYNNDIAFFDGKTDGFNMLWYANDQKVERYTKTNKIRPAQRTNIVIPGYRAIDKCRSLPCRVAYSWGLRKRKYFSVNDTFFKRYTYDPTMLKGISSEQFANLPIHSLHNYVFNVNSAGWRNLDWLMKIPAHKKTPQIVLDSTMHNCQINLLYNNYKSLLPFIPVKNYYRLSGCAKGEPATIYGFMVKDGTAYFASKSITVGQDQKYTLDFKKITLQDLYKILSDFDKATFL